MGKINDTLNDFTNMPEVFADFCIGEKKAFMLMSKLIQDNRFEEARRIADNTALRKKLYLEYGI